MPVLDHRRRDRPSHLGTETRQGGVGPRLLEATRLLPEPRLERRQGAAVLAGVPDPDDVTRLTGGAGGRVRPDLDAAGALFVDDGAVASGRRPPDVAEEDRLVEVLRDVLAQVLDPGIVLAIIDITALDTAE